jgi:hypothetical protein
MTQGLNSTPFGGLTLTIGKKGMVDCEKECPEHRTTPEIVGNTSMASSYYFTLVCTV